MDECPTVPACPGPPKLGHWKSRITWTPGVVVTLLEVHAASGLGLPDLVDLPFSLLSLPLALLSVLVPLWLSLSPATPLQVFLTATHSHSSPFDVLEGYVCPVLFGTAWGGDHHHDNHGAAHGGSHGGGPGAQHSVLPAKSKEELSEGSRKKKTKKAD